MEAEHTWYNLDLGGGALDPMFDRHFPDPYECKPLQESLGKLTLISVNVCKILWEN